MNRDYVQLKPPGNWLNDPNGFIFYKGLYHLFFQHNPKAPVWDTMHWGHAVSPDLVSWEHKGIALYPSVPGDIDGCFSGSAVERDGKLHLFYTGMRMRGKSDSCTRACQIHIASEDGFAFDNESGKTVVIPSLTDLSAGDPADTRDPKVWREGDRWTMILGSTTGLASGMLTLFESDDLENWHHVRSVHGTPEFGFMWECPDLFRTDGRDVLIFSPMGLIRDGLENPNQAVWMLVSYDPSDHDLTLSDKWDLLDHGMDLYAPQSAVDSRGRRIVTAWARMPEPVGQAWNGMMCAPRVVEAANEHVYFRMHPNIRSAFSREIHTPREAVCGKLLLSFSLKEGESAGLFGLCIKRDGGRLVADRSAVYPQKEDARTVTRTPLIREGDRLEVLVDPNLIEIYVNNGEYVLTNVVYGLTDQLSVPENAGLRIFTIEPNDL